MGISLMGRDDEAEEHKSIVPKFQNLKRFVQVQVSMRLGKKFKLISV